MNSDPPAQALELCCQVGAQRVAGLLVLRGRLAQDHLAHARHDFALPRCQPAQYFGVIWFGCRRVGFAIFFYLLLYAAISRRLLRNV